MRPRHKAAENIAVEEQVVDQPLKASMRPRHKAAENVDHERMRVAVP